ncbi:hypothetical protein FQA39_LY07066 [Lamprigera yunnana]|nr:hypothetical protein FQA39_LY07066 [Lamprigera yunnana]
MLTNKRLLCSINQNINRNIFNVNNKKLTLKSYESDASCPTNGTSASVGGLLCKWKNIFINADVSEPKESIEYILAHVLGSRNVSEVYRKNTKILLPEEVRRVAEFCEKRLERTPIQYIIQEWDFCGLTLKMKPPVFIPRPETEMMIDIVLSDIDYRSINRVLEFCCGSGAICVTLLKARAHLCIKALDKSREACDLAEYNAKLHSVSKRLKIIHLDIKKHEALKEINENYDIIVSNPPYLSKKDLDKLQPEIQLYEDPDAFDGGEDGLILIKSILRACSRLLNFEGKLFMEVDSNHPMLIKLWLSNNKELNLNLIRTHKDFNNKERYVEIIKE